MLPPLPEGRPPPAGVSIPNAISQTLQAYPPEKLADIISQLKAVATSNPEQGTNRYPPSQQYVILMFCSTTTVNGITAVGIRYFPSNVNDATRRSLRPSTRRRLNWPSTSTASPICPSTTTSTGLPTSSSSHTRLRRSTATTEGTRPILSFPRVFW